MPDELSALMDEIRGARKYRRLDLPESTLRDLLDQELSRGRSRKETLKIVRRKLHNIVAPYLGDPDYAAAHHALSAAFAEGAPETVKAACSDILSSHASTRERLPLLDVFYERLFTLTGKPDAVIDLACGLNPLSFPWMGLPLTTRYYAYDIHRPRVELINHYFNLQGLQPSSAVRDVLVEPPPERAPVALLLKEAHRFEQRRRGCNLPLWRALQVRYLLVSLPARSLSGRNDLGDKQRRLFNNILDSTPPGDPARSWGVSEIQIGDEIIFCIDKGNGDVSHTPNSPTGRTGTDK